MKETLSDLKTAVALNTDATKGLKEVVQNEFNRHYEFQKNSDQRVAVTEIRIDRHDILFAKIESIPGRVESLETLADRIELNISRQEGLPARVTKLEERAGKIHDGFAKQKAWQSGAVWAGGIALLVIGFILEPIAVRMFDLLLHSGH